MVVSANVFSPTELALLTDCSLQYHLWRQLAPEDSETIIEQAVRQTIWQLHVSGGPRRFNLPAALRFLDQQFAAEDRPSPDQITAARQLVAACHRRLRDEWPNVIAVSELLTLNINLGPTTVQCQLEVDRIDKVDDGGIAAVQFVVSAEPPAEFTAEDNIEATMWHALVAAAYPAKRPVYLVKKWLHHNTEQRLQLTESDYRHNLQRMKTRLRNWLEGDLMARPGLHCEACLFQYQGCPIYFAAPAEESDSPE